MTVTFELIRDTVKGNIHAEFQVDRHTDGTELA